MDLVVLKGNKSSWIASLNGEENVDGFDCYKILCSNEIDGIKREVYISKSSTCKRGGRSHVLEAMGLNPGVIDCAVRIGLSRFTTGEDIDALCEGILDARARLAHS